MTNSSCLCLKEEGNLVFRSGDYFLAIKKYSEAIKCFDSTRGEDIDKDVLYSNIAQCNIKLNRWQDAMEASTKALELNPNNEKALYRRALAYEQLGSVKESLADAGSLLQKGNKEAVGIIERVRPKVIAERNHHFDEALPETILANITSVTQKLISQKLVHPPFLSTEEANKVIYGIDTLRTWVIKHQRTAMVVNTGVIPKLIAFLKIRCCFERQSRKLVDSDKPSASIERSDESNEKPKVSEISELKNLDDISELGTHSSDEKPDDSRSEASTIAEYRGSHSKKDAIIISIVTNHEILKIHLAVWRLFAVLMSDTEFSDEDEHEQLRARQLQMLEKPIPVNSSVQNAREVFLSHMDFGEIFELYKAYVRSGLGTLDNQLDSLPTDAYDGAVRARCVVMISEILRCVGTLDGGPCLEILSTGIGSIECHGVVRASLHALGGLSDTRRRYGSRVKALKKSQSLMKALENTLQLLSMEDDKIKEDAEFALGSVFALLADKDRAPEDQINIQDLALVLLSPYFEQDRDPMDSYIGLRALLLLWMADRDSVKMLLQTNQYMSMLVHLTCERIPTCPQLQLVAAEVLMHAMEFGELRKIVLDVDGITELSDLCRCQLRHQKDADLRIKVAAILAHLCMHSEEIRKQVFTKFDFFQTAMESLRQFKVSCPDVSKGQTHRTVNEFKQSLRNFLEVIFFLTLHGAFKSELLNILETEVDGPDSNHSTLAATMSEVGASLVVMKDGLGGYYFSNVFCNLLRSREDKEKRKRRPNGQGPQLDEEQLDALQEFFEKLPEHARPARNGEFDRGDTQTVARLTEIFLKYKVVKELSQLCLLKYSTLNEICAASEAIALFTRDQKHRGAIVKQGAVPALLAAANGLQRGGVSYEQELAQCRQSLAQVCISINPNFLSYRETLDIVPHLLELLDHTYELYQYESCLALTNITSQSEDARNRVFHGQGWRALLNVATGDNDLCRAAGLEGLCNMAMCELVHERFAEGYQSVDLQILMAYLGEKNNERAQSAAAGCLAILSSDVRVALRLCSISNIGNIPRAILDEDDMKTKMGVLLRVATLASNITTAVKIDEPIIVKEPKTKNEQPMVIAVTDEMKLIGNKICEAFKKVDHSYYTTEILTLITPLVAEGD